MNTDINNTPPHKYSISKPCVLEYLCLLESPLASELVYQLHTVHESSLSPCAHVVQAAYLDKLDKAYEMYLRTSRLDLDDYNHEVHEGLHITSMAGTWLAVVEGFGGMRVKEGKIYFNPKLPKTWQSLSFKINFRNSVLKVDLSPDKHHIEKLSGESVEVIVHGESILL
jgi:maltose phosphorylase